MLPGKQVVLRGFAWRYSCVQWLAVAVHVCREERKKRYVEKGKAEQRASKKQRRGDD
jgi:hypothetical protein